MKYWYHIYFHDGIYEEAWTDKPLDLTKPGSVTLNTIRGSKWHTSADTIYKNLQPFMKTNNDPTSTRDEYRVSLIDQIIDEIS